MLFTFAAKSSTRSFHFQFSLSLSLITCPTSLISFSSHFQSIPHYLPHFNHIYSLSPSFTYSVICPTFLSSPYLKISLYPILPAPVHSYLANVSNVSRFHTLSAPIQSSQASVSQTFSTLFRHVRYYGIYVQQVAVLR